LDDFLLNLPKKPVQNSERRFLRGIWYFVSELLKQIQNSIPDARPHVSMRLDKLFTLQADRTVNRINKFGGVPFANLLDHVAPHRFQSSRIDLYALLLRHDDVLLHPRALFFGPLGYLLDQLVTLFGVVIRPRTNVF